jgi:AcrR family transcriptional regulator
VRQEILDTALRLMAQRGYTATSMRALAEACGCNVAILYRHFPSKEAILEAIVEQRRERVFQGPAPVRRGRDDEATLTRLLVALLDRDVEYEYIYRIMLGEGMRSNPAAVRARDELWRSTERAYRRWIVELFPQLAGSSRVGPLARTLRTLVQGAYGELVMVPPEGRARALRRRSRELAGVLAPALAADPRGSTRRAR